MAVDYRFLSDNVDVTLFTDAASNNLTFFVTDKKGEDPNDIMSGINIGIQEYHQADFVQMALDFNVSLFRIDPRGECCLVQPGVAAGRFNGQSSNLAVNNVALATSNVFNLPLTFKLIFRMTASDAELLNVTGALTLYSTDLAQPIGFVLTIILEKGEPAFLVALGGQFGNLGFTMPFDLVLDMCNEVEVSYFIENGIFQTSLMVNGNVSQFKISELPPPAFINEFNFRYGLTAIGTNLENYYSGIMRNIVVTSSSGTLIDIADPSAGTNAGSAADGVPTDITSVSVII